MKDRARSPGFCYQAAGMPEDFGNLGMHVALRLHQRHGQSDVKLELLPLAFARIRQIVEELQSSLQLCLRLDHCRASRGLLTGFGPVDHCLFDRSGLSVVMREQTWLLICNFGKALVQHRSDARVKLTPLAVKERLMSSVLNERVLEDIDGVRRYAAKAEKLGLYEPFQRLSQALLRKRFCNCTYHLIRNHSTNCCAGLCYLFCRTQTIEPGDQQTLQSVRNRQRWKRTAEQIFVVELVEQPSLQDCPDQLLDEQWHPIRKVDDLAVDLARQPFAGDLIRHRDNLTTAEPVEHEGGGVRVARP